MDEAPEEVEDPVVEEEEEEEEVDPVMKEIVLV